MQRYVPASVDWLRRGEARAGLLRDALAGVTVGVVALPLAMAFAIASGVPPERGLFTAIVAGFLVSALGGSRVLIGGPTGAFVVIVYGVVHRHGYDGLATATLMAGLIVVGMGVARLGALIRFIPYPVTTGFTSGIAVVILSQQLRDFFGLAFDHAPEGFLDQVQTAVRAAGTWNPWAAGVAAATVAVIVVTRRVTSRLPGPIVAVVLATVLARVLDLPVETIGSRFGGIPSALPAPAWPTIDLAHAKALLPDAFTIAFLCAIESLLAAVVADGMTGFRHKPDCELVGQGLANVGSVLFGGIPATGAIARTVTSIRAGGRSPLAGMVHAATLLLVLLVAAPLAASVPLAALAGVLVVVAWHMAEIPAFRKLLGAPRSDVAVLLATFGLTVFVDLTLAVGVGLVLASLLFMRRMAELSTVEPIRLDALGDGDEEGDEGVEAPVARALASHPDLEVYEIRGPLFFGVADLLKETLTRIGRVPRVFLLRMRRVPVMDATGLHALEDFVRRCQAEGTTVILSGVGAQPRALLERGGLADRVGRDRIHATIEDALVQAHELLAGPPR